jgi:hypothetical protein
MFQLLRTRAVPSFVCLAFSLPCGRDIVFNRMEGAGARGCPVLTPQSSENEQVSVCNHRTWQTPMVLLHARCLTLAVWSAAIASDSLSKQSKTTISFVMTRRSFTLFATPSRVTSPPSDREVALERIAYAGASTHPLQTDLDQRSRRLRFLLERSVPMESSGTHWTFETASRTSSRRLHGMQTTRCLTLLWPKHICLSLPWKRSPANVKHLKQRPALNSRST